MFPAEGNTTQTYHRSDRVNDLSTPECDKFCSVSRAKHVYGQPQTEFPTSSSLASNPNNRSGLLGYTWVGAFSGLVRVGRGEQAAGLVTFTSETAVVGLAHATN